MGDRGEAENLYVGIDVGGTKIQASLVLECGTIVAGRKCATPRDGEADEVLSAIEETVETLLHEEGLDSGDLAAVGIAVPGVTDPGRGRVIITPNMNLTGVEIVPRLEDRLGVVVVLGNDTNLGTLGERWLGAARGSSSVFGIFVGTGIGGGFVRKTKLWRGHRESAGEIGHTVIRIGGPACACGNHGSLEALAGRWAIERDIRKAVAAGRKTVLTELLDGDLSQIRSGALRQAIGRKDRLVTRVMRRASEVLGQACVVVFHLLDPEVIVLGGGVVEACGDFMLPIVEEVIKAVRLPGSREGGEVYLSPLGDDAVVVGAVALARWQIGRSPFNRDFAAGPHYDEIGQAAPGQITVGDETYKRDIVIRVSGEVKKWRREAASESGKRGHEIRPADLARACRGGPQVLVVGTGESGDLKLTKESQAYLRRRAIEVHVLCVPEAIDLYNKVEQRKAALIHVG